MGTAEVKRFARRRSDACGALLAAALAAGLAFASPALAEPL
jgi:hypothetical protein